MTPAQSDTIANLAAWNTLVCWEKVKGHPTMYYVKCTGDKDFPAFTTMLAENGTLLGTKAQ